MIDITEDIIFDFLYPEEYPRDAMSFREYLKRNYFGDILPESESNPGYLFARFIDDDSEFNGLVDYIVTYGMSTEDKEDLEVRLADVVQVCRGG